MTIMSVIPKYNQDDVHRRLNILTGNHVLVCPHRAKRPWKGQVEENTVEEIPAYEPACYLCPGNSRVGGHTNPKYDGQWAFPNDFPALMPPPSSSSSAPNGDAHAHAHAHADADGITPTDPLWTSIDGTRHAQGVFGTCKVLCFHPRHDLTLAKMSLDELGDVIRAWRGVYEETSGELHEMSRGAGKGEEEEDGCVMIFENRGAMMGASAPHPHGQIWGTSFIPDEPARELERFAAHRVSAGPDAPHLLLQYAQEEVAAGVRVIAAHEAGWIAVVPFWATWPFEVLVLPSKRVIPSLVELTPDETAGLASVLKKVLGMYDALFDCPFPYSMGIHQSPTSTHASPDAQLHIHFLPPLLRSATVRKFMVGFELLAEGQRDLTPEQAAGRLRDTGKGGE